jgi:hypothetical protein
MGGRWRGLRKEKMVWFEKRYARNPARAELNGSVVLSVSRGVTAYLIFDFHGDPRMWLGGLTGSDVGRDIGDIFCRMPFLNGHMIH